MIHLLRIFQKENILLNYFLLIFELLWWKEAKRGLADYRTF